MNNTFILLCAGSSRNLSKHGPVSNFKFRSKRKTILDTQVENIRKYYSDSQIIVVTGFENEKFARSQDYEIIYDKDYESKNQSDSINLAIDGLNNHNVWIIHGDIVFSKSALKTPDTKSPIVFFETKKMIGDTKIGLTHNNNYLITMDYGLPHKWTQIFYVPSKFLNTLKESCLPNIFTYEVINNINSNSKVMVHNNRKTAVIEIDEERKIYENTPKSIKIF